LGGQIGFLVNDLQRSLQVLQKFSIDGLAGTGWHRQRLVMINPQHRRQAGQGETCG
jgi:hypothetical protein